MKLILIGLGWILYKYIQTQWQELLVGAKVAKLLTLKGHSNQHLYKQEIKDALMEYVLMNFN